MADVERRPDPPPLQTDDVATVTVGTVGWAVALVVLLALRLSGVDGIRDWWLLMCLSGAVLGVLGVRYCQRRQRAIARDAT